MEKLEITALPDIDKFHNQLNDCDISEHEYQHAQKVWQSFDLATLGDYYDLYMKTDILLLCDVFENFRQLGHDTYGLDPAWYYTMPGYSWSCMLKYTKCRLDIIKDVDMLLFVEKGIRGGISQCCNRFSQANNKYMGERYDPQQPSKYILYLDVNNLYGWAMREYLPSGGFKWIEDFDNLNVLEVSDTSDIGYILEVDLEYPEGIHDSHKDFPLCAEHRTPPGSKLPKLLTTLYNKENYVVHYRILKQALENGLILRKVHRVLQFEQSAWLQPYIELNTKLRAQATTTFGLSQLFGNLCVLLPLSCIFHKNA